MYCMTDRILQFHHLSHRDLGGYIGCIYFRCRSLSLHFANWIARREVDLVNSVLVDQNAVEVELDRKTCTSVAAHR